MQISQTAILLLSVTSFTSWSALYGILCLAFTHKSYEWSYRVVVTVHCLAMLVMSAACELFNETWRFSIPGQPSTNDEIFTLAICQGYFIFDLIHSIYQGKAKVMWAHHAIAAVGARVTLTSGICGAEVTLCLFLAELTNPMLMAHWFLRDAGMADHILYEVNQLLFLASYIVIRMGLGSYLLYLYIMNPLSYVLLKIGGIIMWLVNVVFMGEILKKAYKNFIVKKRI
ncbi:TLC domain-containing protein 5-like [Patiria miniata]|uniref:TLC domain-containing protein n=1 Tax=Patiria miniata TaxID=46514 RepID=A0A914ARB2_PATMI|nr:TLC domain-containing protein 5-like [Patiria miniata]